LNEVDDSVREEILDELEPETVAEGVRELQSDDAVELLEDWTRKSRRKSSKSCRRRTRRARAQPGIPGKFRRPPDADEFIAVPPDWTVGQAIDYMRDAPSLPERFYEIYAVDKAQHWQGAVSLDALLRSRRPVPLAELIDETVAASR